MGKIRRASIMLLSGAALAGPAWADTRTTDIVVMRKVMPYVNSADAPKGTMPTPTPGTTPTPTPGGTPTPTPSATPTPTPTSGAKTVYVPTGAIFVSASASKAQVTLTTAVMGLQCQSSQGAPLPIYSCDASSAHATGYGTIVVSSQASSGLRVIVINPAELKQQVPTISDTSVASLCSSSASIDGVTWKLRCDPALLRDHYRKAATYAYLETPTLPAPTANKPNYAGSLNYYIDSMYQCIDTDTGKVTDATWCSGKTGGATSLAVSATYAPAYRTVVIDRQSILSKEPYISNMDSVCSDARTFPVTGGNPEGWRISCNPADITDRYISVPTTAKGMSVYPPTTFDKIAYRGGPDVTGDLPLNVTYAGLYCRDTTTGQTATSTLCKDTWRFNDVRVPATFSTSLRTIVIDYNDVLKVGPEISNTICATTTTVVAQDKDHTYTLDGIRFFDYKVSCDREALRNHYRIAVVGPIVESTVSWSNGNFSQLSINRSKNTSCIDTDTGSPALDQSRCANIAASNIDNAMVPAVYEPQLLLAYVNWNDVLKVAPEATNKAFFCSGGSAFRSKEMDKNYKITCNPDDIRLHYKKVATTADKPTLYTTTYFNQSEADYVLNQAVSTAGVVTCIDTDTNAPAKDPNACANVKDPAEVGYFKVDFKVSSKNNTITMRWADLLNFAPNLANRSTFCSGTISLYNSRVGTTVKVPFSCT